MYLLIFSSFSMSETLTFFCKYFTDRNFLSSEIGEKLIKDPTHFSYYMEETWKKYQFREGTVYLKNEKKYTDTKIFKRLKKFLNATPFTRKKRGKASRKTRKSRRT